VTHRRTSARPGGARRVRRSEEKRRSYSKALLTYGGAQIREAEMAIPLEEKGASDDGSQESRCTRERKGPLETPFQKKDIENSK